MRTFPFFYSIMDSSKRGFKKNGKSDMVERHADRNNDDLGSFYLCRVLAVSHTLKEAEPEPGICRGLRLRDGPHIDRRQIQGQRKIRIGGDEVSIPHG